MSKAETVNKWITKGSQSVLYKELLKYNGHSLCIEIVSDAYDQQCSAVISIFSPDQLKWNGLWSIPPAGMETEIKLCYAKDWDNPNHFSADRDTLISCMADIL
jgi:hypothetical protein